MDPRLLELRQLAATHEGKNELLGKADKMGAPFKERVFTSSNELAQAFFDLEQDIQFRLQAMVSATDCVMSWIHHAKPPRVFIAAPTARLPGLYFVLTREEIDEERSLDRFVGRPPVPFHAANGKTYFVFCPLQDKPRHRAAMAHFFGLDADAVKSVRGRPNEFDHAGNKYLIVTDEEREAWPTGELQPSEFARHKVHKHEGVSYHVFRLAGGDDS